MKQKKSVVSFSGGKDSTLALYHTLQTGEPLALLMMLEEQGLRSRSHAMPMEMIQAQAASIGLPLLSAASAWENYEQHFLQLLQQGKALGAEVLVTGDLDVPAQNSWHAQMAQRAGLALHMPLYNREHRETVDEFIALGFSAIVVTVNLALGMRPADLGRVLRSDFIEELESRGIDPSGEGGEFHTTVVAGPIFKTPVTVQQGTIIYRDNYAFLPLQLAS